MAKLTVAVLNHNGKEILPKCLDSIFQDRSNLPDEVLVIDNGSTDGSGEEAFKNYPINLRIANNEHQFITGLNESFKWATHETVFFISNDVFLEPGCIQEVRRLSQEFPNDIIQPTILNEDGSIQNRGLDWMWPAYSLANKVNKLKIDLFTTAAFWMSKSVFKLVGNFDTNFSPAYYEDMDYTFRAKSLGLKTLVSEIARIKHRSSHTFSKVKTKQEISKICRLHRKYFIQKHFKGVDKFLRLAVSSCLDVMKESFDIVRNWRSSQNGRK